MSLYYPNCSTSQSKYACLPCAVKETGRVRSVAFKKRSYTFSNPESGAEWNTAVNAGNVIVIWQTQGSYDGGATAETTGFGDIPFYNGNTTHTLTFKDPNVADNCDFYNDIKNSQEWEIVFRTETKIWFSGAPVTVTPKIPVADDINSVMTYEVVCKWTNVDLPCPYDTPANVFDKCYINA